MSVGCGTGPISVAAPAHTGPGATGRSVGPLAFGAGTSSSSSAESTLGCWLPQSWRATTAGVSAVEQDVSHTRQFSSSESVNAYARTPLVGSLRGNSAARPSVRVLLLRGTSPRARGRGLPGCAGLVWVGQRRARRTPRAPARRSERDELEHEDRSRTAASSSGPYGDRWPARRELVREQRLAQPAP